MRNAKLRKQIDEPELPELTQENIDNLEDVTGTVNPSKVSFGGGGPEVLKDWTTVSGPNITGFEMTSGLALSSIDGVGIEFEVVMDNGTSNTAAGCIVPSANTINSNEYNSFSFNTLTSGASKDDTYGTSIASCMVVYPSTGIDRTGEGSMIVALNKVKGTNTAQYILTSYLRDEYRFTRTETLWHSTGDAIAEFNKLFFTDPSGNISELRYRVVKH